MENNGAGSGQMICRAAYIALLTVCLMMSGCTRREQLVLEVETDAGTLQPAANGTQETGVGSDPASGQTAGPQQISREQTADPQQIPWEQTAVGQQKPQTLWVHVCGAVRNPGVYELPAGSRVYEAVEKAGGFTEEADESYVNQAQTLTDGAKLVIPTLEQTQTMSFGDTGADIGIVGDAGTGQDAAGRNSSASPGVVPEQGAGAALDGKININTATEAELCSIPGIGATRAAAIVAYRQEQGGFTSIEDIMNVSGIKEGTYAKIKDSIRVN